MKNTQEPKQKKGVKGLLTAGTGGGLALRIVILLAIPYAYLMLCGLIFDKWLHLYNMTNFVFFSMIALFLAALVLIVLCIVWFCNRKKQPKAAAVKAPAKKPEPKTEEKAESKSAAPSHMAKSKKQLKREAREAEAAKRAERAAQAAEKAASENPFAEDGNEAFENPFTESADEPAVAPEADLGDTAGTDGGDRE